jgi:pSer/pThr/pTyr-binding forkhead associated (FHA) protein
MTCGQCGTVNPAEARFCLNCGARFATAESPRVPIAEGPRVAEAPASSRANLQAAVERMVADRPGVDRPFPKPVFAELPMRPEPVPALPPGPRGEFRLIFVHHDGTDGTSYLLRGDQIDIGRTEGDLLFEDPYLSPRHARIVSGPGGQLLTVLESRNGIFIRLRAGADLKDGDVVLVGRQVLQFELVPEHERSLRPAVHHNIMHFGTHGVPAWGRLLQLGPTGVSHDVFHLGRDQVAIGREQADIVFSDDQFMSRRHATVSLRAGVGHLEDLGSSNGTFLRLRDDHLLVHGDVLRMGNVLLRFENA